MSKEPEQEMSIQETENKKSGKLKTAGRVLAVTGVTLLIVVIALLGVLYTVFRGPSESLRRIVTLSFNETSAVYWVPDLFLPHEKVEEYLASKQASMEPQDQVTNTELIQITAQKTKDPVLDENGSEVATVQLQETPEVEGLDPDGDGIILEEVHGPTYRGYMMIVLDPSRMALGKPTEYGDKGLTLQQMYDRSGAVAAVNGGGFDDPNGEGTGGIPEGIVIYNGQIAWGEECSSQAMVGFDREHRLLVGSMSPEGCLAMDMVFGCHFGPSLIINGVPQNDSGTFFSGVNPRTAIGQRADGAVLLLVIEGRQIYSPGATLEDLVEIMLQYGAVNASNLDGGSSSMMIYNGEVINKSASVVGLRMLPTAFLVMPKVEE